MPRNLVIMPRNYASIKKIKIFNGFRSGAFKNSKFGQCTPLALRPKASCKSRQGAEYRLLTATAQALGDLRDLPEAKFPACGKEADLISLQFVATAITV